MHPDSIFETIKANEADGLQVILRTENGDLPLRSSQSVIGAYIQARDGDIGHVEDFIVDDETWVIQYLVVDTRNWLPGKKVLIAPAWIEEIEWPDGKVYIDLNRETIKRSPAYDPSVSLERSYEEKLYDYYDRRKYWT